MKLYCFDPGKGRNILAGEIIEEKNLSYFIKKVNKGHYMVIEGGYGISEEILQLLAHKGITEIRIKTKNGLLVSNLKDWLLQPIKNYGHGNQRFLGGIKNGKR